MPDDDAEQRTTPIGLARYAREYFDAALAADEALGERKGYEVHAPPPVMFLIAHSIELALKAYMRHKGRRLRYLERQGHDLEKCWRATVRLGVEDHVKLEKGDMEVLKLISDLHVSTQLRYIRTGYKNFPVFGPLQTLAKKLLDAICPLVGYR